MTDFERLRDRFCAVLGDQHYHHADTEPVCVAMAYEALDVLADR